MLSWGWDITTTKSTLQCWSGGLPVFPGPRPAQSYLHLPSKSSSSDSPAPPSPGTNNTSEPEPTHRTSPSSSVTPPSSPLLPPLSNKAPTSPSHLPPTPASSPPASTASNPTSPTSRDSSSMHLVGNPGGVMDWPMWGPPPSSSNSTRSPPGTPIGHGLPPTSGPLGPPPPPPPPPAPHHHGMPLTPGIGSPPGAFCFPPPAEELDEVYRYKEQLRTEQLVQAYMDAIRQSLEQEYGTNNNNSSNSNNNSPNNNSNNLNNNNNNNTNKSSNSTTDTASSATDSPAIRYLQQLLPFAYSPSVLSSMAAAAAAAEDDGKPLDLSATSQVNSKLEAGCHDDGRDPRAMSPSGGSSKPSVELKVPQILKSGKKKDLNGKKAYTEEELAAAVNDIRSGKLGTRRAAVLYGIPRSTLRNKIFKLESEQNGAAADNNCTKDAPQDANSKLSMVDLLQGVPNGDYPPSAGFNTDEHMNFFSAKHLFVPGADAESWDQKIEQIRRKHSLLEPDRKFGFPPMHFPTGHHLSDFEKSYFGSPFGGDMKLAFLPELVRRMAEERMELERQQSLHSLSQLDLRIPPRGLHALPHGLSLQNGQSANGGVELKVPSYKPMRSSFRNGFLGSYHLQTAATTNGSDDVVDPSGANDRSTSPTSAAINAANLTPKIGDTLKDIIAKTIAEKMRCRAMLNHSGSSSMHQQLNINSHLSTSHLSNNPGPLSSDSSSISSNDMGPVEKKPRLDKDGHAKDHDKKNSGSSDGNASGAENKSGGRKTRPKRGQYRKYNSQLLLEAVRAVQRGEMSVHRAGSYFGVPHSTLEYKVKERHLLRLKKVRSDGSSVNGGGRSSGGANGNGKKEGGNNADSSSTLSLTLQTPSSQQPTTTTSSATTPNSSRSVTPTVCLSPPLLPTNSAMSVISNLAHQATGNLHRLTGSSALSPLGGLGAAVWGSAGAGATTNSSGGTGNHGSSVSLLPPVADGLSSPGGQYPPAGFALNTSASELLKKLQRKVQAEASLMSGADSQSTGEMAAALRAAAAAAAMAAASSGPPSVTSPTSSSTNNPPTTPCSPTTEAAPVIAQ